jgi:hypothetical protein
MKTLPSNHSELQSHTVLANRPVTRQMVYKRTLELASLAGRAAHQIKQVDYERAKRELTGESDFGKQQAILDYGERCQS